MCKVKWGEVEKEHSSNVLCGSCFMLPKFWFYQNHPSGCEKWQHIKITVNTMNDKLITNKSEEKRMHGARVIAIQSLKQKVVEANKYNMANVKSGHKIKRSSIIRIYSRRELASKWNLSSLFIIFSLKTISFHFCCWSPKRKSQSKLKIKAAFAERNIFYFKSYSMARARRLAVVIVSFHNFCKSNTTLINTRHTTILQQKKMKDKVRRNSSRKFGRLCDCPFDLDL